MGQLLIYNNQLSAAYSTESLTASQLCGKHIVLLHNGGTLYREIEKRLVTEGAELQGLDYTASSLRPEGLTVAEIVIVDVEWEAKTELLRLKSVSKEQYDLFFQTQVTSLQKVLKTVLEKSDVKKIILLLPSFAFDTKYGFTLYGMAAERVSQMIDTETELTEIKTLKVHYGKTLKANVEVNADIYRKTGLQRHVLMREQVSALIAFLSGPIGNNINQNLISIGLSAE